MNSTVTKRSVVIAGRKTSISLEDEFWNGLKAIAHRHHRTLSAVVGEIDQKRRGNLSSAIRVFVFGHLCGHALEGAADGVGAKMISASPYDRREPQSI
jgi:predicted DNA-binding ribbon-helix-helix protein